MSFTKVDLIPCNPATSRGEATKLSASKDKIAYTNGRTVIVRRDNCEFRLVILIVPPDSRFEGAFSPRSLPLRRD